MINKDEMFSKNELFEFKTDSLSIDRVEYRIRRTELANKYVKKTTRLHQNNKKLIKLEHELRRSIYNHNKFDLFIVISKEIDSHLNERMEREFKGFASIDSVMSRFDSK